MHLIVVLMLFLSVGEEPKGPPVPLSFVSLPLTRPVVVDGDLGEWDRVAPLEMNGQDQLNIFPGEELSRNWGGIDDVSAVFYVHHSTDALYIAGEVRDDYTLYRDVHWWNGDAVEVFLDTDFDGDRSDNSFSDDDYQIFLMPYNEGRKWGICFHGRKSVLGDGGFVGVQIGHRSTRTGYTFEAVLPFVNFPRYDPAKRAMGFNLAISDHDLLPGGGMRHNYIVLNGKTKVFQFPWNMCRLDLRGEPVELLGAANDGGWSTTTAFILTIVAALAAISAVTFFSVKIYNAAQKYFPRWRYYGVGFFIVFMLLILALPKGLVAWKTAQARSRLAECSATLPAILMELCSPEVDTGRGGVRTPQALADLINGKKIPIEDAYDFSIIDLGCIPRSRSLHTGTPFYDYGFPLEEGRRYVFPAPRRNRLGRVVAALRSVFLTPLAQGAAPEGVIENALEVSIRCSDGEERVISALDLYDCSPGAPAPRSISCGPAWTRDGLAWHEHTLVLPEEARQSDAQAVAFRLVNPNVAVFLGGITAFPAAPDGEPMLFHLGNETLTGVPTWLRDGSMPRGCELRIRPASAAGGAARAGAERIAVPGAPDVLYLVYASRDDRLFDKERYGEEAARCILRFAGGAEETRPILAGVHIDHCTADHPEAMESAVAHRWIEKGTELHCDVLRIDVDRADPLESISVVGSGANNLGMALCAATAGTRVERRPIVQGLLREQDDHLFVAPAVAAGMEPLRITVFEEGIAAASSHQAGIAERLVGTRVPADAVGVLPPGDFELSGPSSFQAGGKQYLGVYVAVPAKARGRYLVRAALEMKTAEALGGLQNALTLVAVVLFLPFFIMFFVDALGRVRLIRLKMTSLFVLTSVVPIVILSLLMFNHLGTIRDGQLRGRLQETLSEGKQKLESLVGEAERLGRNALNASKLLALVAPGAGGDETVDEAAVSAFLAGWMAEVFPDDGIERAARLELELEEGKRRLFFDTAAHIHSSLFDDTESGLYFHWSRFYFVGTAQRTEAPRLRLTVAGEVTPAFLRQLAADVGCRGLTVGDAGTGYPIVDAGIPEPVANRLRLQREINAWIEARKETFVTEREGGVLVGTDLVNSKGGRLTLEAQHEKKGHVVPVALFMTQMEVDDFFLLFGAVILAAAVFIGSVTTDRITKPIEKLETGAREVSRGNLSFTLDEKSGDEMGRLAKTFNRMTAELKLRMDEQKRLTRNMEMLSAGLEFNEKVDVALGILMDELLAERVVFFLYDARMGRFRGAGDTFGRILGTTAAQAGGFLGAGVADGGLKILPRAGESEHFATMDAVERELVPADRPLVVMPLPGAGKPLGVIIAILPAGSGDYRRINVEYAASLAHQISVSFENARLFLLATQDPDTGFYTRPFFRHRLAEEVDRAVYSGGRLALVRVAPAAAGPGGGGAASGALEGSANGRGALESEASRIAAALKTVCRDMYIIGHNEAEEFDVLLPDADRSVGLSLARSIMKAVLIDAADADGSRIRIGIAFCPEDATSAEFLLASAERSLETGSALAELKTAEDEAPAGDGDAEDFGYVFHSPKMREILSLIARIARSSVSVLVVGETGTGKEVVAELIHRRSERSERPFVRLNCSALPESLLESELFGHEKGAFTGAEKKKAGHFEAADQGTIFLDEVGDIPLRTQAKLLRVLQDKTIEPLGSSGRPRKVDVRIIAATNKDLAAEIRRNRFREDLYFRLKVISIAVPPLRERKEDIPVLAQNFIEEFNRDNKKNIRHISPAALDRCYHYHWPGNVRELRNVLNRAMLLMEGDAVEPVHLVFESREPGSEPPREAVVPDRVLGRLSSRQVELLNHLQAHGSISNKDYIEKMKISPRTGLRDLQEMIKLGLIVRLGTRRAAVYKLKQAKSDLTAS